MDKIFLTKKTIYIIIILSAILSLFISKNYLNKYDTSENKTYYQKVEHPMIKAAIINHWFEADEIIKDIKKGKNFFVSGSDYDEFLPQRLLALYYLAVDENIYDQKGQIKIKNKKFGFLLINTLLFYFSLFYFTKILIKKFPIKNVFIIILFVSLEPTIFQYHSSFFNESYGFPLQIILISLAIQNKEKFFHNFLIGITIGLLYCLGTEFLLYFLPASIYFIIIFKKKFFKPLIALLSGYVLIMLVISVHNFYRVDKAYFATESSKSALYTYLVPSILADKNKITTTEAKELLLQEMLIWSKKNNIELNDPNTYSVFNIVKDQDDEDKFLNYLQNTSIKILLQNPYYLIKYILNKSTHALTLNPFYIKNFYSYDSGYVNKYYGSDEQKKNVPYRIVYSLVLYLIIFRGFLNLTRSKENGILSLVLLLSLYQVSILGWMGDNRYIMPILLYLSIFFSFGIFPKKN